MDAAGHAGQRARDAQRDELVAVGRHAHHLGRVFVVVDREQADAELGHRNAPGHQHRQRRCGQRQQVESGRLRRADGRYRHCRQRDAVATVDGRVADDGADDEGDRQRQQREHLAADALDAEDHRAQRQAQQAGHARGHRQRPQKRPLVFGQQRAGGVDAGAEEGAVAEGKVAGVARQDVPRRGQHDPQEDQVQQRVVEGRQAERGHEGQRHACAQDGQRCALHAARPGRNKRIAINSVNDTSGAQDGAVTAIVTASLTPITTPAISGASARPRPPSMTAAKTTPIQA